MRHCLIIVTLPEDRIYKHLNSKRTLAIIRASTETDTSRPAAGSQLKVRFTIGSVGSVELTLTASLDCRSLKNKQRAITRARHSSFSSASLGSCSRLNKRVERSEKTSATKQCVRVLRRILRRSRPMRIAQTGANWRKQRGMRVGLRSLSMHSSTQMAKGRKP